MMWKTLMIGTVCAVISMSCTIPGSAYMPGSGATNMVVVSGNPDLAKQVGMWVTIVQEHIPDALIVNCHGETMHGKWYVFPDIGSPIPVKLMIDRMRAHEPHRTIVLLICNPDGHKIDNANVVYARGNVWVIPDRYLAKLHSWERVLIDPDAVGSWEDFTINE